MAIRFLRGLLSSRTHKLFGRKKASDLPAEDGLQASALPMIEEIIDRSAVLPEGCREYLAPAPLQEEGMLIGRDNELEELEKAYRNWQDGHPMGVALVGHQGCGKTSLINCFLKRLSQNVRILRNEPQNRLSSEQLVL